MQDVKAHKWTFLIADPFDRTYNPAKQVLSHERLEEQYYDAMLETLEGLTEAGEIWMEPSGTYDGLPMVKKKPNKRTRM